MNKYVLRKCKDIYIMQLRKRGDDKSIYNYILCIHKMHINIPQSAYVWLEKEVDKVYIKM